MYFIFHNQLPPLTDVNLRKALCYAFDYDGFINSILGGSVARNAGIIPGNLWGAPKDLAGYSYDLAKAKSMRGWSKAPVMRPLEIGVLAGFDQSEAAAQLMQAGAAKIGIEIKLASEPWPVISGKVPAIPTRRTTWCRWAAKRLLRRSAQLDRRDLQQPQHRRPGIRVSTRMRSSMS